MSVPLGCACLGAYLCTWLLGAAHAAIFPSSDVLNAQHGLKRPVHFLYYFTNLTNVVLGFSALFSLILPLQCVFDMLVLTSIWGVAKDVAYWLFDQSGPRGWRDVRAWDSVNKHVCSGYVVAALACFTAGRDVPACTYVTLPRVMGMGVLIGTSQVFAGALFWAQMHREFSGEGARFRYAIISGPRIFLALWLGVGPLLIGAIGWVAQAALRWRGIPPCPSAPHL